MLLNSFAFGFLFPLSLSKAFLFSIFFFFFSLSIYSVSFFDLFYFAADEKVVEANLYLNTSAKSFLKIFANICFLVA